MTNKLEFKSLSDLLDYLEASEREVGENVSKYKAHVAELTGHDLSKPITALDVVKIVKKVFGVNPIEPAV